MFAVLDFIKRIGRIVKVAKENSGVLDAAESAYRDGATLVEIARAVSAQTPTGADDVSDEAIVATISKARNTLWNLSEALRTIGSTADSLAEELDDLSEFLDGVEDKPLRAVLEDDVDES